jgi:hypothetical protein
MMDRQHGALLPFIQINDRNRRPMAEKFRQTKEAKSAGCATIKLSTQSGTSFNTLRNT